MGNERERYPIGFFSCPNPITQAVIDEWIEQIRTLPRRIREAVNGLEDDAFRSTHREGGWTIPQLVHHIADSHMNYYFRIKLALTEETPTIRPFYEDRWAELVDSTLPVSHSIQLIESLQVRLLYLLQHLDDEQLKKSFVHPQAGKMTIAECIGFYAWHGEHHLAHIQNAIRRYQSQTT